MYKGKIKELPNLSETDLGNLEPSQFYSYLYIFDTQFLNIITPINLVYYTKYTL